MDKKSWILSKHSSEEYINKVLDGVTLINGANCTIDSITPSPDGKYNTVVFGWTGTSTGQHYTSEMRVDNGEDGRGIKNTELSKVSGEIHLIVTYDDDTTKDVGAIPIPTVEVGETTTVDFEEGAKVTSSPTNTGIKLDFQIPRGEPGEADPSWNII